MPLEAPFSRATERAAGLNARYRHHSAARVLEDALSDPAVGRAALVSSFGAESVALLHLVSVIDRTTPVLFIDTEMLFPETLSYQAEVAERLKLTDVRIIKPSREEIFAEDVDGILHLSDPDACCTLRKTRPLEIALEGFDAWITGRKRFQGGRRTELEFFEAEGDARIKINPLAHWTRDDVQDYMINNRLPRHPLVSRGYRSIGCAPCTTPVGKGEDDRAGRWRGSEKEECGIHFVNGKIVPGPLPARGPRPEGDAA
ncbi:MAG: phosphoadenylyl-sulfate reductase [Pseudomonadota bacterium]